MSPSFDTTAGGWRTVGARPTAVVLLWSSCDQRAPARRGAEPGEKMFQANIFSPGIADARLAGALPVAKSCI
jgi:hypothetical protein